MNKPIVSRMPFHRIRAQFKRGFSVFATVGAFVFLAALLSACSVWPGEKPAGMPAFVSTAAGINGEFGEPFGIAVRDGSAFVSDGEKDCIWRLGPDGPEVFASGLDTPSGITFDANGNLIVADTGSHTIRSVDAAGVVTVVAGIQGNAGSDDGDRGTATFHGPIGVAVGPDGVIYVADTYNDRIRMIANGKVTTLTGDSRGYADGSGAEAKFDTPTGIALFGERLIVTDTKNGRLRVVEKDGRVWTLAGTTGGDLDDGPLSTARLYQPTAIAVDKVGSIYFTDGNAVRLVATGPIPTVQTISTGRRGFRDGNIHRSMFNRPSGLAVAEDGVVWAADSENGLVRQIASEPSGTNITAEQLSNLRGDPVAFRNAAPPRWPYDPPTAPRDIAGTLGEIRGEITDSDGPVWFHNGLDIAGAYGETARFIRGEKVLRPLAAENFGTLRELIRMPTLGYIHIRLGRDVGSKPFDDRRFSFDRDESGKLTDVRIPRGAKFLAGEPIGTLNAMNHVHLVAGRSGYEMNGLDALILPGLSDTRAPIVEKVTLFDENWREIETVGNNSRINLNGKIRVMVRAYDQADGNSDRRRLGLYRVGYQILTSSTVDDTPVNWKISFDRLPESEFVRLVYGKGSHSGATGTTIFNYIVSNTVNGQSASEGFVDTGSLENGIYILRVHAADYFGNTSTKDVTFEVNK